MIIFTCCVFVLVIYLRIHRHTHTHTHTHTQPHSNPLSDDEMDNTHTHTQIVEKKSMTLYLKNKRVWAIILTQYFQGWGLFGLMNLLPSFVKESYGEREAQTLLFTALPYFCQACVGLSIGRITDTLITRGVISKIAIRRLLQTVGMIAPALAIISISTLDIGFAASAVVLTTGLSLSALTMGALTVNHIDIAPEASGFVFGVGNTFNVLGGFIAVNISGIILEKWKKWSIPFTLIAAHYFIGIIVWNSMMGVKPIFPQGNK
eukprot:GHVR01049625.1.p1 GENE.GHVR01049625.1~~GHVR01049625.1.p1  ORF type:complete len:262 (+),score=84.14 GHVR01049625.1:49-834(+)